MRLALITVMLVLSAASTAETNVRAQLVADHEVISPGKPFRVGVQFRIPPRAHIYWHNPGDTGLPTSVEFTVPDGFTVSDVQWPFPSSFRDDILKETSFGYEFEVLLFATVQPSNEIQEGDTFTIHANAAWLVCLEDGACIPEDAKVDLALAAGYPPIASKRAYAFDRYADRVPIDISDIDVPLRVTRVGDPSQTLRVAIDAPWEFDPEAPLFVPDNGGSWTLASVSTSHEIELSATKTIDAPISGALTLYIRRTGDSERKVIYVRFGEPKGD